MPNKLDLYGLCGVAERAVRTHGARIPPGDAVSASRCPVPREHARVRPARRRRGGRHRCRQEVSLQHDRRGAGAPASADVPVCTVEDHSGLVRGVLAHNEGHVRRPCVVDERGDAGEVRGSVIDPQTPLGHRGQLGVALAERILAAWTQRTKARLQPCSQKVDKCLLLRRACSRQQGATGIVYIRV
eukprot:COSAG01_NODE_5725_length_4073_cov_3.724459_6_plen_186_part_00